MKAVVCTKYGSPVKVVQLRELEKPAPADDQVLIKVHAASLNVADLAPIKGAFVARLLGTGLLKPKRERLGTDVSGRVEAVGRNVTRFQPGDEVFGWASGGFAEYVCTREDRLVSKPANATYEEAATLPVAALTALQGLRKGQVQPGQKVLVYGASGGVGCFAVQVARSFGTRVTAVCSPRNLDQARAMGVEHVIDYTGQGFNLGGEKYDLVLAVNGYRRMREYRDALTPQGTCVLVGGSLSQIAQGMLLGRSLSETGGRQIAFMGIAKMNHEDLLTLQGLLESGKIQPLIERRYPLSETARALGYLAEGHVRSKLVIEVIPAAD